MAASFRLDWNGDQVRDRVRNAARVGIDRTLLGTVEYAKSNHPWQNRSLSLLRSHQQIPAITEGTRIVGRWGVGEPYGFWLEVGTATVPPYTWLRPAADATYGALPGHIRDAYKRGVA